MTDGRPILFAWLPERSSKCCGRAFVVPSRGPGFSVEARKAYSLKAGPILGLIDTHLMRNE
jgi:hypothetical protein